MHVFTLGLNHATAPVEVREKVAVAAENLSEALDNIAARDNIVESIIVSTCNRTEIYCRLSQADIASVYTWLCEYHKLQYQQIEPYLYVYKHIDAIQHSLRVASGLDSMVLGEPQILGQMKTAFAHAHKNGNTGKILNRLFQHAFSVAKEVRSNTSIGSNAVSVAYASVSLAKQIFSDIAQQTVLLIGAGETIELACRHLHSQGVRNIIIANRTLSRAEKIAQEYAAQAISLHELPTRMSEADIIFSSTASTLPILGKGAIESALKKRKNKPIFIVDLAIPRDVEEQVSHLNNVYLYTVDDLQQVVNENLQSRKNAALEAEKIIEHHTQQFAIWLKNLQSLPTIKKLREHTQKLADKELLLAKKRLSAGENPDEVLQYFAYAISQKFMHRPTESLREQQNDNLLLAAIQLFDLEKDQ